jgi:hypothetical protein
MHWITACALRDSLNAILVQPIAPLVGWQLRRTPGEAPLQHAFAKISVSRTDNQNFIKCGY